MIDAASYSLTGSGAELPELTSVDEGRAVQSIVIGRVQAGP